MPCSEDFLAGRPARASTTVPGHWILQNPHSPSLLHARRFRGPQTSDDVPDAETSADAARRAAAEALLSRHEDALDKAWQGINSHGVNESREDVKDVLSTPCATIDRNEEDGVRELWLFEIKGPNSSEGDQYHREILNGLDARPPTAPVKFAELLVCSEHGHDLSCLDTPSTSFSTCQPIFDVSKHVRLWTTFTNAVAEKLAWRSGTRWELSRSQEPSSSSASPQASLKPLSSNSFLLQIRPAAQPVQTGLRPLSNDAIPNVDRRTELLPLNLPGYYVAPYRPSPTQESTLTASFAALLGSSWRSGRRKRRIRSRLLGETKDDWAVYWVSIPDQKGRGGTDGQGVLTIWPLHLTNRDVLAKDLVGHTTARHQNMSIVHDFATHSSLLDTASSLFDILSSYKATIPPSPEPAMPTEGRMNGLVDDEALKTDPFTPQTGPGTADISPRTVLDGDEGAHVIQDIKKQPGRKDERDDIDDLFSSSGSPDLKPSPDTGSARRTSGADFTGSLAAGTAEDFDALFNDVGPENVHADVPTASPVMILQAGAAKIGAEPPSPSNQSNNGIEGQEEVNATMVTEDDFDFFDSPTEVQDRVPIAGEPVPEILDEMKPRHSVEAPPVIDLVNEAETAQRVHIENRATKVLQPAEATEHSSDPTLPSVIQVMDGTIDEDPLHAVQPIRPATAILGGEEPRSNSDIDSQLLVQSDNDATLSVPKLGDEKRNIILGEAQLKHHSSYMIPTPFSAIHLPKPASHHTYSRPGFPLPSPGTTPEALRLDLIERLHTAKRQKLDYITTWHINDESSDTEETYDDSGAPPTPESQDDSWNATIAATPVSVPGSNDSMLEWEGIRCVGAEWAWLDSQSSTVTALCRKWSAVWNDSGEKTAPALPSPPASPMAKPPLYKLKRLSGIDLDDFADQVASNRYFRGTHFALSTMGRVGETVPSALSESGISLRDLAASHREIDTVTNGVPEPSIRTLEPCNVNAAYNNNVLQMSSAGIRYWRQLGLSPVGGAKDVSAVILAPIGEMDETYRRAASMLERGLRLAWAENNLGIHQGLNVGDSGSMVLIPVKEYSTCISRASTLVDDHHDALIVYILFSELPAPRPPIFPKISANHNIIIHFVPISAVQPHMFPTIAMDVYNRVTRPLQRIRGLDIGPTSPTYFQYPSWTLAADSIPRPELHLSWPLRSYDVLNRWRWVHAAFSVDHTVGALVGFVVDSEGENWEVKAITINGGDLNPALKTLWDFATAFANSAAVEWRMSLCWLGDMTKDVREAFMTIIPSSSFVTTVHVKAATKVIDPSTVWSARAHGSLANITPAMLNDSSSRIVDETMETQLTTFHHRLPLTIRSNSQNRSDWGNGASDTIYTPSFLLSMATASSEYTNIMYHIVYHQPAPSRTDENVMHTLGREYQKLAYLGRARFGFEEEALPVQVAGVKAVMTAYRCLVDQ